MEPVKPAPVIIQAPEPTPVIVNPQPSTPSFDIWRSRAVYTAGLQYPHVVVGNYPLDRGTEVDVMVPFVDGSLEEHPGIVTYDRAHTKPMPSIIASLGPAQGNVLATEIRSPGYYNTSNQQPVLIQELDDSGRVIRSDTRAPQGGLIIGPDQHIKYENAYM